MRYEDYEKDAKERTMPSSQFDILRAASDPKKLSNLGMSSGQMLEYGLNLKGRKERENETAMKLGVFGANVQAGGGYGGGFLPILSAQQAFDISKNPEELRRRGISAEEALEFGNMMGKQKRNLELKQTQLELGLSDEEFEEAQKEYGLAGGSATGIGLKDFINKRKSLILQKFQLSPFGQGVGRGISQTQQTGGIIGGSMNRMFA
jgi:hypothetical protein